MTIKELMAKLDPILPQCELGEDLDGQVVVYTNLKVNGDELVDLDTEIPKGEPCPTSEVTGSGG